MKPFTPTRDPADCTHERVERIGIQKAPFPAGKGTIRLYLVTCLACGTTLTTRTLRDRAKHGSRCLAG